MSVRAFTIMNILLITFSSFASAALVQSAHESNLRGSLQTASNDPLSNNVLCRFTIFGTMYTNVDQSSHDIRCIPIVNGMETDMEFSVELPESLVQEHEDKIHSGTLLVSISDAAINENGQLLQSESSQHTVISDVEGRYRHLLERHRRMATTMTVAVIRVSTQDMSPTGAAANVQAIQNTLFGSGINFLSQYDACSHGKMQWKLSENVFDVKLPGTLASYDMNADNIVTEVQKKVKTDRKVGAVSDLADKVIMCLPPGTGDWAASAGVNHWRAQMNNEWCTSLSGTMHELGHTLGLAHSNANGVPYTDRSGYMGSGYTDTVWPRKCFNGYNNFKFGWFNDKTESFNPVTENKLVRLATFVDYDKASATESVVINLNDKYFLQYNAQKGFNTDTEQYPNAVTITEPVPAGTENRGGLDVGQVFQINNYNGSGKTLKIKACRKESSSLGADVMIVSIGMDVDLCNSNTSTTNTNQISQSSMEASLVRPPANAPKSEFMRWFMAFLDWLNNDK